MFVVVVLDWFPGGAMLTVTLPERCMCKFGTGVLVVLAVEVVVEEKEEEEEVVVEAVEAVEEEMRARRAFSLDTRSATANNLLVMFATRSPRN
jgi:hypothetical protein